MSFTAALVFLTSIPLPLGASSPVKLGRSTAFFPVIGLVIGLVLAGLNWLLGLFLPPSVVSALLIVSLVITTGALHLDGFADTCDGLAGNKPVEERWKVMRDSRTGAFGAVGIVLLLLIKYVSLASVPASLMTATLLFTPVVSRWAMVYAIFNFPYAHATGLGTSFKQATRWLQFTIATAVTVAIAIALALSGFLVAVYILPGIWAVTAFFAYYFNRKFAGLTGDNYGAINELAEAVALLLVSLLAYTGTV